MRKQGGFTLIELSVVLTIVALLIAGVFVGQSLIRTSHLRETLAQYSRIVKAVGEFRDKYQALPGDYTEAETTWGADAGCPAGTDAPKAATCDGNGNGLIGLSDGSGGVSGETEWYRAWQQLANAGFIEGQYTGIAGAGGAEHVRLGINAPRSAVTSAGWSLFYFNNIATSNAWWGDSYGHVLLLGSETSAGLNTTPFLTPTELQEMDDKIDDGKPGRGVLRSRRAHAVSGDPNCTANDTTQDAATYKTSYTGRDACAALFIPGF